MHIFLITLFSKIVIKITFSSCKSTNYCFINHHSISNILYNDTKHMNPRLIMVSSFKWRHVSHYTTIIYIENTR